MVYLEKYAILGGRIDFADILQDIKNEKGVKGLKLWVVLDSSEQFGTYVFGTFFHLQGYVNKIEKFLFCDNEWRVRTV